MTETPDAVGADIRSFHLDDDLPALYLSLQPDVDPQYLDALVPMCVAFGLRPLDTEAALAANEGTIEQPLFEGWQCVFAYDRGDKEPPLMTIEWPAYPQDLVHGARKSSPAGWSTDAIDAGQVALIVGPPIAWHKLAVSYDGETGLLPIRQLMRAIGRRPAASALVPATVRG